MRTWQISRTETGFIYLVLECEEDRMNGEMIGPMWNEEVAAICLQALNSGVRRGKLHTVLRAFPWYAEMVAAQPEMGWDEE